METFDDWHDLPQSARGTTLALGAFDGLHLGHVAVLQAAQAARPGAALAVAAFEPPPKCFFAPQGTPCFRLNTPRLRAERAGDVGAKMVFALPFNAQIASMAADDFVRDIIHDGLAPCHVTIGHDFRFGAERKGDGALLTRLGDDLGFGVTIVDPVLDHSGQR